jgi:hypothetical protein
MAGRSQHAGQIMENQTRFDLNAAVENWHSELAAQPNLASDDRRELETHLHDAIAGFQQRGLNDEESFWLARRRVGQPHQLCEEFIKANPTAVWRERAFWMVTAILTFSIWGMICSSLFAIATATSHPSHHFQKFAWLVYSLVYVLPVIGIMILIARGKLNKQSLLQSSFFCSRLRLGIVIALLVMALGLVQAMSSLWSLRLTGPITDSASIQILIMLLSQTIIPLVLVGLFVWLMPTQNRKTLKRV